MIRVTYRLMMDAPHSRQTRRTLVRFSTGMEIAVAQQLAADLRMAYHDADHPPATASP
jgi:hypothetical protein